MAREYYYTQSWTLADDPDYGKWGSGGRETLRFDDGNWITDEMIEYRAERHKEAYIRQVQAFRAQEMEIDRKAAEPFWRRWLG